MTIPGIPPGPRAPRAVQTLAWLTRPGPFMERARRTYGDTFTVRIANEGTWVFVTDPADVRTVFTGDPDTLRAGEANIVLRPVLGPHSVLMLDGPGHMAQRKLLLPPFHGERMQRYGDLITEVAEAEIGSWSPGTTQLWPRMQAVTLAVIVRAIFGVQDEARAAELRRVLGDALDWTTRPSRMVALAALGPDRIERLKAFRRALAPVDEAVFREIRERRDAADLADRDDILSLLLAARHDDGTPMSDTELRDELMTLLVAGHETTATSLAWAAERLVRTPAAWARLREEAHTERTDYADAVVRETLRLRPVLPLVGRKLAKPFTVGGYELPAGATVAPCIWLVHRRPDVYPDPTAFRPERFLDAGGAVQAPGTYTWLPFGGGVRRCLGAAFAQYEMRQVLRALARSAALRAPAGPSERVARRAITLVPSGGAEVVLDGAPAPG